jgi:hypothetical protein
MKFSCIVNRFVTPFFNTRFVSAISTKETPTSSLVDISSFLNDNMAPAQSSRPEKDKRLKTILCKFFSLFACSADSSSRPAFATDLEAQLPAATRARTSGTLLTEIENQLSNFPAKFGTFATSKCEEVDQIGTTLWNLCTRLRRDVGSDNPKDVPIILLLTRVFSFLLLDGAYEGGRNAPGNLARLMKIGIKAGKSCIG